MEKLLVKGVEVQFSYFSKELQEKLYLNNKEEFQEDAANSQYEDIRRLLIEDNQTTDKILKQVLKKDMEQECISNMVSILKHPNFKENKAIFDKLSQSKNWEIREITAMASNSFEFLNEMLINELEGEEDGDVKQAIFDNPRFK